MPEIEELLSITINNIVLVRYFSAFLTPRRNNKVITVAGFGITSFILDWVRYFFTRHIINISDETNLPVQFLFILTAFPALLGLSALFFKKMPGLKIYLTVSFLVVGDICFFISVGLLNLLGGQGAILLFIVMHLTYPALCVIAFESIIRNFSYRRQSFTFKELLYIILPCFSGFALTAIIRSIDAIVTEDQQRGIYGHKYLLSVFIPLAGMVFLITLIAAVRLFQNRVELEIAERSLRLREQIMDTDKIYAEMRSIRHDMKGHLGNIKLLAEKISGNETDAGRELTEYLNKFGSAIKQFDFTFQTGNSITDVIMHRKYAEAVKKGIKLESGFVFPSRLKIDAYDLAVILNNALENAIEAASAAQNGEGFILIDSHIKGDIFFITVVNSFAGEIEKDESTGLPLSSKTDAALHGFGLLNIKRCAQKYSGDVDYQVSGEKGFKTFRLTVMLQGYFMPEKA